MDENMQNNLEQQINGNINIQNAQMKQQANMQNQAQNINQINMQNQTQNINQTNMNNQTQNINQTNMNNQAQNINQINMQNQNQYQNSETKIIQTDVGNKDGQNKCPRCGATDITIDERTGKLRCNFCRFEFEPEKVQGMENDITKLEGETVGSSAQDIQQNQSNMVTLKCTSCGAEVVIDISETTQARCHWCRNILSINNQVPNGIVPDVVLPFKVTKQEAKNQIEEFVGKRKTFANPTFTKEFTTDNIMGVYFPYMVVDENIHATFEGQAEVKTNEYLRGSGDNRRTYYDADLYNVGRDFDLAIEGLTVESSKERLQNQANKTNNVINAIMPFDTENCAKFNSNYLKGYSSEKRDTNIDELRGLVNSETRDIARYAANDTIKNYDRGASWNKQQVIVKGTQWKTAYLPVWLYSYVEKKSSGDLTHYVAVNARTKETMGSVPIHMPKLIGISALIEVAGILGAYFLSDYFSYSWILALIGILYFLIIYFKYRNTDARHAYETDTKRKIFNLRKYDNFVTHETGLQNSQIRNSNNSYVSNKNMNTKVADQVLNMTGMDTKENGDITEIGKSIGQKIINNEINKFL